MKSTTELAIGVVVGAAAMAVILLATGSDRDPVASAETLDAAPEVARTDTAVRPIGKAITHAPHPPRSSDRSAVARATRAVDQRSADVGRSAKVAERAPAPVERIDPPPAVRAPSRREPPSPTTAQAVDPSSSSGPAFERMADRYRSRTDACYRLALAAHPALIGTLVVRATVDASGRVSDVRIVRDTLHDPTMVDCLVAEIRSWRADPLPAAETSTQTFTFGR